MSGSGASKPQTPAELHEAHQRLRALFTAREPAEVRTGVVPVGQDRVMVPGSTAHAVTDPFISLASGLRVPAALAPEPLGMVQVYLTGEQLFGVTPSPEWTVDELQRMTFTGVLDFIAATLLPYRHPGVSAQQADLEFAERWLAGRALVRARNLLRDPAQRLVAPQALYVLAKLAAFHSPDAVLPGVDAGLPAAAMFGAVEAIEASYDTPADDDLVVDLEVGPFTQQLIANHHLNAPGDEVHLMARFARQWLELPGEHAGDPRVVDLQQVYEEVTGVALSDVLAVGVMLWAAAVGGKPRVLPGALAALNVPAERVAAVLELLTVDVPTLRVLLQEETERHGLPWAVSTLEQHPVVRLEDGALLVLDIQLLARRLFGGLTLYDIVAPLSARGGSAPRKQVKAVKGCVAHLAEVYALEVLESLTGAGSAARRVFDDAALQRAYRRPRRRIADAAVDYGDAWVVVEVTTTKLRRESVAAISTQALSGDLDKLVGEVEQIDHTIDALRADEARLTGAAGTPGVRRFFPLLVVADGFPINPISIEWLRQRTRARGLLTGPDTAPLEVVDTVELEMLEALAHAGGPSLREVLAAKEHAALHRSSVRDYLRREAGYDLARSQRVDDLMAKASEPARRAAQKAAA